MSSYLRIKTHIQSPGMLAFMGLLLCGLVHWNARMTEMKRSGIEVILAFAVILCPPLIDNHVTIGYDI